MRPGKAAGRTRRDRVHDSRARAPRGFDRWTVLALAALTVVLLWIPVATGLNFPSKLNERDYHIPAVESYAGHFPGLAEMRDTNLSMLPLLHGALGQLARLTGTGLPALRFWMFLLGLLAIWTYGRIARELPGNDWRTAALTMAAFPYFGACYFLVLTEGPGLLAAAVAVFWQMRYWEAEDARSLWIAGGAGAAACLVRQNLIIVPAVFALAVIVRALARAGAAAAWRKLGWVGSLALALPAGALVFQVWLWRGFLPPFYQDFPNYYEPTARTYLRSLLSIAANVGYYLLPATLAWAVARWRRVPLGVRGAALAASIGGAAYLRWAGAGQIVNTAGLFNHAMHFLGHQVGSALPVIAVAVCLFSFLSVIVAGWERVRRSGRVDRGRELLALILLIGTLLVVGFGLATIYERHIIIVYALAALVFLGTGRWKRSRLLWWGWGASVLFGVAHGILYAAAVHEIVPAATALYDLLG